MFTGIIKNQGKVLRVRKTLKGLQLVIQFLHREKDPLEPGESIAVNGACLTAARVIGRRFEADVISETLNNTNLSFLKVKDRVNLERSLKYGDRFGGHFVTGHVDGCGRIERIERKQARKNFWISAPRKIRHLIHKKGSVAVEGISLTVQEKNGGLFKVSLVPHTLRRTNLNQKRGGDRLNVEVDILARYLNQLTKKKR